MPYSVNGIGTKYYGHADRQPDNSYIATLWIVLLFIPLIPLRSYRLKEVSSSGHRTQYQGYRVPLNFWQVARIYCAALAILAAIVLAFAQVR